MKCGIAGCCISVVLAFTIALLAGLRRSIDNSLGAPHGLFGLTWLTKVSLARQFSSLACSFAE